MHIKTWIISRLSFSQENVIRRVQHFKNILFSMERTISSSTEPWSLMGNKIPKSEIVYFCQMIVVYIIIITSIVNLSLRNGSSELWISLISSYYYILCNIYITLSFSYTEKNIRRLMLVNYDLSNMSIPFQPCSSMCISGQTGSGKTQFVYRLLTHLNDLYDGNPPKKYCILLRHSSTLI